MDRKYNSSEDDAPLCPIHCNLYVGYVHLCSPGLPVWLPLRCGERLPFLTSTLFPLIMIRYLRRPEHIRPSHAACRWLIYDKHSAASHYFGSKSWNRPSHSRPTYRCPPRIQVAHLRIRKIVQILPPKERRSIREPFHRFRAPFLKVFFHGNQWCSARYTRVCRVYPLQSELRIPTYQSPP